MKRFRSLMRATTFCLMLVAAGGTSQCGFFDRLECDDSSIQTGTIDGVDVRCTNGMYLPQ